MTNTTSVREEDRRNAPLVALLVNSKRCTEVVFVDLKRKEDRRDALLYAFRVNLKRYQLKMHRWMHFMSVPGGGLEEE